MIRIFTQFLTSAIVCASALAWPATVTAKSDRAVATCLFQQDQTDTSFDVSRILPYQLDDAELLLRPPITRQGFSNMIFDERSRRALSNHELLLVLSWSHAGQEELKMRQTGTHLEQLAREYERSVWFVGLYGEALDEGTLLLALKAFLQEEVVRGGMLDVSFYKRLCAILPSDHVLLAEPSSLNERGVNTWVLHLARHKAGPDHDAWSRLGIIQMHLSPAQRFERHRERKLREHVILALGCALLLALLMFAWWRKRGTRLEELWRFDEAYETDEHDAFVTRLEGVAPEEDPMRLERWFVKVEEVFAPKNAREAMLLECIHARLLLHRMLEAQLPLARRSRSMLYGLLRGPELLRAQSELYRSQVALFEALQARTIFQPEQADVRMEALGYSEAFERSGLATEFVRLSTAPIPEFDRSRAPEPWMSYLIEWYVWVDLMVVELELRSGR